MSNKVYVIRNQHGLYLTRQQEWVDGRDNQALFRCTHHDEAINTVFEVSSRDILLRAEALACPLDARNHPQIEAAGQLRFDAAAEPAEETGDDTDDQPEARAAQPFSEAPPAEELAPEEEAEGEEEEGTASPLPLE